MSAFPAGETLTAYIRRRHRISTAWRYTFLAALSVGIIALGTLIYTVINDAFGLVAVQSDVTPSSLVLDYQEARMLSATEVISSEDDQALAIGVADNPFTIGFFGYAYLLENAGTLQALRVDGVEPNAETAESGDYPLARPLFLVTSQSVLEEKPQTAAFISYYLDHVNEEIGDVGYFPASADALAAARQSLEAMSSRVAGSATTASGDLSLAGSSTIYPLTQRLLERFVAAGFTGSTTLESLGTTAGLRRLCIDQTADIVNASRPLNQAEIESCRANGRAPITFRVGTDALAVVVSRQNDYVTDVSQEQLRQIFTTAEFWSDVDPAWPAVSIGRLLPGADSGTLDFFAETVFNETLADLPMDTLVSVLAENISLGLGRRLERDQLFYENRLVFDTVEAYTAACSSEAPPTACTLPARSQENVYELLVERVVKPEVLKTWSLADSLLRRPAVALEAQRDFPSAELEFRSWLNGAFLTNPQSSKPEFAGVRTALLGSIWVILITIFFSFPIGVGAAIYLEEYARATRLNRLIQTNINNLAGVPSIIYGMLGLAIFVRALERLTSGSILVASVDPTTANGRTILSAGLTLGLLILPIIIISAQEAIRAVPSSLRQASYGLGATKWQTVWYHVLPNAFSGILTGTILAMSRAIGETAPLVVVGASTFITVDPNGPFSKFTTLPIQIYQWTSRPQDEFRNIAAAAILVLLVLLIALNASAIFLRNRYSRRTG